MSSIISMSLSPETLSELETVQKQMGFSGRSETIRAGIRLLASEQKERTKLRGTIEAALMLVHDDHGAKSISKAISENEAIIKTHLHNHVEGHRCLEILVLRGAADSVKTFVERLQAAKSVEIVKLVVC